MTQKLVFTPTEEDLRFAYALHMKQMSWKRIGYFVLFGLTLGVVMAGFNGFDDVQQAIGLIIGMTIWAGAVALIMTLLLPIWWVPRYSRKIYKQQKDLHLETTTWWDDEKLYSGNAQGHAHLTFADMVKWRADDNIVLLYRSDQLFNFLPARIFSDAAHKNGLIRRLEDAGVPGETKS
ncbi:YcxB family protein [Parasphingorhabdus sp.]|uniref:YcxB family protein n=1 Tax=Parasphingorhabdus sp. TaxID=2709688 RepID=UPI003BB0EAA4